MSTAADTGGAPASGASGLPIFTRKSTGLVREVSLFDQLVFNATATSPLGTVLVFGLFALVLFPRANPYIALIVALLLGVFVWTTFALLSAAIPRIGGDYTFNSRILHPVIGFAGNLCAFVSAAIAAGLWAWWLANQALSPAFGVIGDVTHTKTFQRWSADFAGTPHNTAAFVTAIIALAITSVLALMGTRVIVRVMTALFLIAAAAFVVDMLILLFTTHASFTSHVDHALGAGTYQKTVAKGHGAGIYPSEGGYSGKETIGAIYTMISVTLFTWWGTYLSAEFKGAGQRKRQLWSMVGAGLGQGLIVLFAMVVFLTTVGHSFFASALSGNFPGSGTIYTAGYAYFSALVASNKVLVTILALAFVGWWLPGLYINTAMCQRAIFTWSFDGLLPKRFGEVNERTHTPVLAILISFAAAVGAAAWVSYTHNVSDFFKIFAVMQLFAYIPVMLVGVSALVMKWRRPDLYEGSPAQWKLAGVEVLPVAGLMCALVGAFSIGLIMYFHKNIGITGTYYTLMIVSPFVVLGVALVWWLAARSVRKSEGIDLALVYKAIPPD